MPNYKPRFARAPWTYDARDLTPQGDPETTIFLPNRETIEGLHIVGLETDLMLGVKFSANGTPLSCAVTNEIALDLPLQSNPRRTDESDVA